MISWVLFLASEVSAEDPKIEPEETIPKVPSNNFLMRRSRTPSPIREQRGKRRYTALIIPHLDLESRK